MSEKMHALYVKKIIIENLLNKSFQIGTNPRYLNFTSIREPVKNLQFMAPAVYNVTFQILLAGQLRPAPWAVELQPRAGVRLHFGNSDHLTAFGAGQAVSRAAVLLEEVQVVIITRLLLVNHDQMMFQIPNLKILLLMTSSFREQINFKFYFS